MYKWLVMPFRLENAHSNFQRKMDDAFKHIKVFYIVYTDNMLVFSKLEETHIEYLERVTNIFKQEGVILYEEKIEWFIEKVSSKE